MKFAKRFATVQLFVSLLPMSGLAGDQQTPGCVQPPTDTTTTTTTYTVSSTDTQTSVQTTSPGSTTWDTLIFGTLDVVITTLKL